MPCEDNSAIEFNPPTCLKILDIYGETTVACMQLLNEVDYRLHFNSLICNLYFVPFSDLVALVNSSGSRISLMSLSGDVKSIEPSCIALLYPDLWNVSKGYDSIDLKLLRARYQLYNVSDFNSEVTDIATGHVEYSLQKTKALRHVRRPKSIAL